MKHRNQLNLWKSGGDSVAEKKFIMQEQNEISSIGEAGVRKLLEEKYNHLFKLRLDLRQQVTYVPNKHIPVYNWFRYKEGFSRDLVFHLLKDLGVGKEETILDPFAGCGTTLLACKEYGCPAVGLEILPIAVYVTTVKLLNWPDPQILKKSIDRLLHKPVDHPKSQFPDVEIIKKAFSPEVQKHILFYRDSILEFPPPVRDFLMLGLISILEQISYTSKDGQFLRLVSKKIPPVKEVLRRQLMQMFMDLQKQQQFLFKNDRNVPIEIFEGDAREMCLPTKYHGKISGVITSPPYLNRYDYSRTYALELCTISVETFDELRGLRHRLLRSHIESKELKGREINLPALDEILKVLAQKSLNNNRIPVMIKGYFEDMNLVIKNLSVYLKKGGKVALVVANARFEGEYIPTDLMLCELAKQHGFETRKIWITRFKGNSSQQMAKYGRCPVRETIVFWEKIR
ncbi:MAG: hypothetical protein D6813_10260 [Calditrichaeota bacterium]|nr:MAG: hypothetical protein D6813_10260 [Calditrichota bacterium]